MTVAVQTVGAVPEPTALTLAVGASVVRLGLPTPPAAERAAVSGGRPEPASSAPAARPAMAGNCRRTSRSPAAESPG